MAQINLTEFLSHHLVSPSNSEESEGSGKKNWLTIVKNEMMKVKLSRKRNFHHFMSEISLHPYSEKSCNCAAIRA